MDSRLRTALKKAQILENFRPGEVRFSSLSLRDVEEAEAVWEVRFPEDFRSFLLECGGCALETWPRVIWPGQTAWRMGDWIIGYDREAAELIKRDVVGLWASECKKMRDRLELDSHWGSELVPVTAWEPAFKYCFDFRFDSEAPPIVFYDVETGIDWDDSRPSGRQFTGLDYVADSFTHFVEQLRLNSEDDSVIRDEARRYPKSERQLEWEAAIEVEASECLVPQMDIVADDSL